jgi:hypothetical protein
LKKSKVTASNILSIKASQAIPSPISSFADIPVSGGDEVAGRKMSALELDDTAAEIDANGVGGMTTTNTPGSLDSSRSMWDLGSAYDPNESASPRQPLSPLGTSREIIQSRLMRSSTFDVEEPSRCSQAPVAAMSELDKIMFGIESVLDSIGKSELVSKKTVGVTCRLCIPTLGDKDRPRLCGIPQPDRMENLSESLNQFGESVGDSIQSIWNSLVDKGYLKPPEMIGELLGAIRPPTLSSSSNRGIPLQSVPILNRRQRRAAAHASKRDE